MKFLIFFFQGTLRLEMKGEKQHRYFDIGSQLFEKIFSFYLPIFFFLQVKSTQDTLRRSLENRLILKQFKKKLDCFVLILF